MVSSSSRRFTAVTLCALFVLVAFEIQGGEAATVPKVGQPYALALQILPPKLPADGNEYSAVVVSLLDPSGRPSFPTSYVTVYLTSSQQNVATVDQSLVISPGSNYGVANLTTTITTGSTVITAASPGLQSASSVSTTVTPSGFPSSLKVFVAPSTVPARPGSQGVVIVELLDKNNLPTKPTSDITIQLTTSEPRVANLTDSTLTLQAGNLEVQGGFLTTFRPGQAVVTASAPGLGTGRATVNVKGPAPTNLKVYAQPAKIPVSTSGKLTIVLTDSTGNPARAQSDITVLLSSSNTSLAKVKSTLTIPGGSMYAITTVNSTAVNGNAIIYAASTNLVTGSVSIRSYFPSLTPTRLKLELAPPVVLADNTVYSSIMVSLEDSGGAPALAAVDTTVRLTASNTQVGTVPASVVIVHSTNFKVIPFDATFFSGSTGITAQGLDSSLTIDTVQQATYGPVPTKVVLTALFGTSGRGGTLPADGKLYNALEVSLVDASGSPAVAPEDLPIQLLSTASGVVSVDTAATIPAGSTAIITGVQTSTLSGRANLTAFAQGLTISGLQVLTVVPAPSALAAWVSPSTTLYSSVALSPLLFVQLQDSAGNPARAQSPISATVTSSNGAEVQTPIALTFPQGTDHISVRVELKHNGSTVLTVTSSGLTSANARIDARSPTLAIAITANPPTIFSNASSIVKLTLMAEGAPLPGATVAWNSSLGRVEPNATLTSTSGLASITFKPSQSGLAKIFAIISHPSLGTYTMKVSVTINPAPNRAPPTLLQLILSYLIYVIPVVAAIIGLVVFRTIRRRRSKAREELEAGFQTLS